MASFSVRSLLKPKPAENPTSRVMWRYAILVAVYLLLIPILPVNHAFINQHRLTAAEYHIMQFLVALPLMAIWFVALYGYSKLAEYTRSISKTPEAMGFERLTQGTAWIAWSLPVYAIASLVGRSINYAHPDLIPARVIIVNYIDLLFPIIGFTLIGMASRSFFERAKITLSAANIRGVTLLFVLGGVLYCYLVFRQFSGIGLGSSDNPFHLPVWLTVLTLVVPYLYAWFVGMLAVYELMIYCRDIRGLLYRQALHMLVIGLFVMLMGSVAFQYSRSTQFIGQDHLFLGTYFIFNMMFQIISGAGFVMIALGAMRLKKIEEV